jgi:diaminohydroxyphosphoribosylaminopyrimidine deaminase/5-amino-6-(5-phosphoribosylamino)uracil reductase
VVSPLQDPNPRVSGNGYRQLTASRIDVVRNCTEKQKIEAEQLIEGFAHHIKTGLPMVTLKLATSLDGKIATRTGDSRWITNEKSRERVHEMRHQTDALITGVGTVLSDNPRLTARDQLGNATGRPILRVVVDSNGRMPASASMLKEPGEILWVIRDDIDANPPNDCVSILRASGKDGKIELSTVIQELGSRGLNDVMVEAGAGLAGAFVEGGHVNKIAAFVAPMIIGGNDAVSAIAGKGIETLSDALTLERVSFSMIDSDILIEGYVSSSPKTYSSSTSQAK